MLSLNLHELQKHADFLSIKGMVKVKMEAMSRLTWQLGFLMALPFPAQLFFPFARLTILPDGGGKLSWP